jgi:hypothetical protein
MFSPTTLPVNDRFEIRINHFLPAAGNHLFNEARFFQLHAHAPRDTYAQFVRRSDAAVYATVACYEGEGSVFVSPKRGTFGGLSVAAEPDVLAIDQFMRATFEHLRESGGTALEMRAAPFSHDVALSSIVANILLRAGAKLASFELNYDMTVDTRPLASRMDHGSRKRIRKCADEGFFGTEVDAADGQRVYELIRANRERRGFPITMSWPQFAEMAAAFPDRLHYFAVFVDDKRSAMAAAAVCLSLSPAVLYVFYWADADGMQSYSPVAMLAATIYAFAQSKGYRTLDVGTSTLGGEPNPGLVAFKRGLGFSESLKPSYILPLRS